MNIQDVRRQNLVEWVRLQGGHAVVCERFGLTVSQASYLSQIANGYSFGERSARNWERRLRLPPEWFDRSIGQPAKASENVHAFHPVPAWPFRVPPERILALPRTARESIDAYIQGVCDAHAAAKASGARR